MNVIAYKLVYVRNGKFYSYLVLDTEIEYKLNEWVNPEEDCGKLCCFESEDNARIFSAKHNQTEKLFLCEIEKSVNQNIDNVYNKNNTHVLLNELPQGTVLADRVMLIKEIQLK